MLEKFFEEKILVNYPVKLVWNTFSNINLLPLWHPLIKKDTDGNFVQKIDGIDTKLKINIVEKKELEFLRLSIRSAVLQKDTMYNIAEFNFSNINNYTEIKFTRLYYWDELADSIENKKNQLIGYAKQVSTSIRDFNFNHNI